MSPAHCDARVDLPKNLVEPPCAAEDRVFARENVRLGALLLVDESSRDVAAAEIFGKRSGDDGGDIGGFCYSGPRATGRTRYAYAGFRPCS
jgi:hypothetical protein